jgi:glycosyltransferase involved in cell wall biosynthesis
MESYDYDIIFIQGNLTPTRTHITGGEFIVNAIANDLAKDYNVAIAYIKNWENNSAKNIIKTVIYSNRFIADMIRKINNASNNLNKSVDILIIKNENDLPETKIIIANFATTVDISDKYLDKHSTTKGFHFIQNELDVGSSRSRHLCNIVVNKKDSKRFNAKAIIPIGIENKWFITEKKENIIIFPLRPEDYKGAKYILEASKSIHEKFPEYKQIGFGWYNKQIPDYIEFKRNIKEKDLIKLFAKSKIFILPSITEGFSLTNLQAMATGCKVITTDCGGIREYSNKDNSIIVPIKNSIAIVEAVSKLINGDYSRLINGGKETARKYKLDNTLIAFRQAISV